MWKMRRILFAIIMAVTVLAGNSLTAAAEGDAMVTFTENSELVYSNVSEDGDNVSLGAAMIGVAPGETRTQTIQLVNKHDKTVDFYMDMEVLKALEEGREQASGAGYDVVLTAAGKELYNSKLGGYATKTDEGSKEGLKAINASALGSNVLVATLKKGETAEVTLQITFDGEGMDNNATVDYSDAIGEISFRFQAGFEDPTGVTKEDRVIIEKGPTRYVTQFIEEKLPLSVKTGDQSMLLGGIVILAAGVVLFLMTGKKKTEGQS